MLWHQFLQLLCSEEHYVTPAYSIGKELKINPRHLQRITMQYAGVSPKEIQSILRCRQAIRHIVNTGIITDFFHYGYFDQAHFIKEVKRWSGHTPKALLSKLKSIDIN